MPRVAINSQLLTKLYSLVSGYNFKKDHLSKAGPIVIKTLAFLLVSYILASMVSTLLMALLMDSAMQSVGARNRLPPNVPPVVVNNTVNFRDVRNQILARNIFNSEGEVPDEPEPTRADIAAGVFDPKAPCQKTSLPVALVGTIYLGDSEATIATVKDTGYPEPDFYRSGETIVGHDQARIYAIEQNRVVINNNGIKECLELLPPANGFGSPAGGIAGESAGGGLSVGGGGGDDVLGEVTLEAAYVEKELGQGFAGILNKGRLVPANNKNGGMDGFRLIAMDPSSLFGKIGLKNNDVITQVNDISLRQPEQGFALYEAFQAEREIRISINRNDAPKSITVRIK